MLVRPGLSGGLGRGLLLFMREMLRLCLLGCCVTVITF
jgi:hypothetical protein